MKWYIWALIGLALILIIWAVTKKKSTSAATSSNQLASNSGPSFTAPGFNPYQLTTIS